MFVRQNRRRGASSTDYFARPSLIVSTLSADQSLEYLRRNSRAEINHIVIELLHTKPKKFKFSKQQNNSLQYLLIYTLLFKGLADF